MATFIQSTFNEISLERDQELWLSADDSRLEDRLRLLAEFPQCRFRHQVTTKQSISFYKSKMFTRLG